MPKDGSVMRQRILDAAHGLVIANGFRATSVDAVLAASGASKGAFFHHFASKRALADALVDAYVAADLGMLALGVQAAEAAGADPAERVLAFVRFFEDHADEMMAGTTGCLYASVLVEMELIEAGASAPITEAVAQWRDTFARHLSDALGDRSDLDIDALSDHLFVTFEGAFLLARTTGQPEEMRRQLATVRVLLEALLRGSASA